LALHNKIKMKEIIKLIIFLHILSCASIDSSRIAPGYSEAIQAFNFAIFGYPDLLIDKKTILNIPYASALMKIGKGPKGLIILQENVSDQSIWVSADNVYLVIEDGRVIETRGLPNNLIELNLPPLKDSFLSLDKDKKYYYYFSYDQPELINLKVEATLANKGLQEVELFVGKKDLYLIEEQLSNEYLGWKVINKYWVDREQLVWKSIQHISPILPALNIEITKKPSS